MIICHRMASDKINIWDDRVLLILFHLYLLALSELIADLMCINFALLLCIVYCPNIHHYIIDGIPELKLMVVIQMLL